jgi:putative transposase
MRLSRYSDEQIEGAVRQAEAGRPLAEIIAELGISEATLYVWKKRLDGLKTRPDHATARQITPRETLVRI